MRGGIQGGDRTHPSGHSRTHAGEGGRLFAIPGLEFSFAAVPAATTDHDENLLEINI